jgi:hypothetical protein
MPSLLTCLLCSPLFGGMAWHDPQALVPPPEDPPLLDELPPEELPPDELPPEELPPDDTSTVPLLCVAGLKVRTQPVPPASCVALAWHTPQVLVCECGAAGGRLWQALHVGTAVASVQVVVPPDELELPPDELELPPDELPPEALPPHFSEPWQAFAQVRVEALKNDATSFLPFWCVDEFTEELV